MFDNCYNGKPAGYTGKEKNCLYYILFNVLDLPTKQYQMDLVKENVFLTSIILPLCTVMRVDVGEAHAVSVKPKDSRSWATFFLNNITLWNKTIHRRSNNFTLYKTNNWWCIYSYILVFTSLISAWKLVLRVNCGRIIQALWAVCYCLWPGLKLMKTTLYLVDR